MNTNYLEEKIRERKKKKKPERRKKPNMDENETSEHIKRVALVIE